MQDLNLRPSAPKADALPNCANPRKGGRECLPTIIYDAAEGTLHLIRRSLSYPLQPHRKERGYLFIIQIRWVFSRNNRRIHPGVPIWGRAQHQSIVSIP